MQAANFIKIFVEYPTFKVVFKKETENAVDGDNRYMNPLNVHVDIDSIDFENQIIVLCSED